jgi:hypothetical protein
MNYRDVMQQALAALEYHVEQTRPIDKTGEAITALRAALKNAEVFNAELSENTRKNMEFVEASLAGKRNLTCVGCEGFPAPSNSPCAVCGLVALEQPVAWLWEHQLEDLKHYGYRPNMRAWTTEGRLGNFENLVPVYTHPPRREWRGLTDTERSSSV